MTKPSALLKYLIPIFLMVMFFLIQAVHVRAADKCCACTHSNVTGGKFCIKDYASDCADLTKSTNTELKDAVCIEDASANPCKKTTEGGMCLNVPSPEISFKLDSVPGYKAPEAKKEAFKALPLNLNIPIPGLTMYDAYQDETEIIVPALAQYIQALQKLLIGIGVIAAALMVMYGGFLYIVSGTGAKVSEGQQIIKDSLIGLIIILGSAVILNNINPNTANLSALHLYKVASEAHPVPVMPRFDVTGPAVKPDLDEIVAGARMAGANPCSVLALCEHETGLRMIWNGWPKHPLEKAFSIGACSGSLQFLRDGMQNDERMRKAFPNEWPPLGLDRPLKRGELGHCAAMPEKCQALLNNPRMNGYLASFSVGKASVNSLADAGIGSGAIKRWRIANKCPLPYKDFSLSKASAMGVDRAIQEACLPQAPAGGSTGCPTDNQNCSPVYPDKINSVTKGYKIETSGTIHGVCASTGKQCVTIWTQAGVRYMVKAYEKFNAKYHCTSG